MSLSALLILSPLLLIVILILIIVEWDTPFFFQKRIGKNKSSFTIYKFRTMKNGKITPIGKFLRKTGIDELPQLINIIMLDMSLVGPRPLTIEDIVRLEWDSDYYNQRWEVRPGIVGLAQLSPVCDKKISWFYDRTYILKKSFFLDFKIIISSAAILFVGKSKVKKWIHAKS